MKKVFISTAIPYVNAKPHLGFAFELVLTDALARFYRQSGNDVFFLTGSDENSLKNVLSAEESGVPVSEFVKENAEEFRKLKEVLNLSFDDFIRTTESRHVAGAMKLWKLCEKDIYKKKYQGLYCVGCEEFKTEKDLISAKENLPASPGQPVGNGSSDKFSLASQSILCCPEHPKLKLQEVEEENYFFKLSKYQDKLKKLVESDKLRIVPETRKKEILSFINQGLEDFSISRSRTRAKGWGIGVPGDESQIMYVWFDALSNYINAYGWDNWQKADKLIHVIGKGVIRFHAIYWPAMLMAAGLRVPDEIFAHGYITIEGEKLSKSLGNTIHPKAVTDEFGVDPLRYYLLREISSFEDGDYSKEKFLNSYNANLANGLGNLVSRIMKMAVDYDVGYAKELVDQTLGKGDGPGQRKFSAENFRGLGGEFRADPEQYTQAFADFDLKKAADFVWGKIGELDKYIQETVPFKMIKTDPEKAKKDVAKLVLGLYEVAYLLEPFLPRTAGEVRELLEERKMPASPLFPRR